MKALPAGFLRDSAHQYGLTAGGPVYLPKVFNGKDKLFWFFAWQHDSLLPRPA